VSEIEKRYIRLTREFELLFHLISQYSLATDSWKYAGTNEPDEIADITYYAEKAIDELLKQGDKQAAEWLRERIRFLKRLSSGRFQKRMMQILNAEIVRYILMMAGSHPEVVEKEYEKMEHTYIDYKALAKGKLGGKNEQRAMV